jgi:Flp pilus assembly protein TadG
VDTGTHRARPGFAGSAKPYRRIRTQRGAIAVEFALIMPLLVMLVLGIIEFGFGYHAWDATQNAAREGARLGAVSDDVDAVDGIEARVRGAASFLDQTQLVVTVKCGPPPAGPFGTCPASGTWAQGSIVQVTVDYSYGFITPLPNLVGLGSDMTMRSVAEARFEGL